MFARQSCTDRCIWDAERFGRYGKGDWLLFLGLLVNLASLGAQLDTQSSMDEHWHYVFEYQFRADQPVPTISNARYFALWLSQPDCGWIDASLYLGDERFFICFSDVYPPFQAFLDWAIGLSEGRDMPPVDVDDEFSRHFFKASSTSNPDILSFEYMRVDSMNCGLHYQTLVARRQVVAEIYKCLAFLMSLNLKEPEEAEPPRLWFSFTRASKDVIRFDLTPLEVWLAEHA